MPSPLEVCEPPADRARRRFDDDARQLVGRLQLENVLERLPVPEGDAPRARRVPGGGNLDQVPAGRDRQLEAAGAVGDHRIARLDHDAGAPDGVPGCPGHDLSVQHPRATLLRGRDRSRGEGEEQPPGQPSDRGEGHGVHLVPL